MSSNLELNAYNDAKLIAQVKTINDTNDFTNRLGVELAKFFRPFVGQQIVESDGKLNNSIQLPELFFTPGFEMKTNRLNDKDHEYYLSWHALSSPNQYGFRHRSGMSVGELQDGIFLKSVKVPRMARTDYTVEELTNENSLMPIFDIPMMDEDGKDFGEINNDVDTVIYYGLQEQEEINTFRTQEFVIWKYMMNLKIEDVHVGEPKIYGLILNRDGKRFFKLIAENKEKDSEFD